MSCNDVICGNLQAYVFQSRDIYKVYGSQVQILIHHSQFVLSVFIQPT